jgi:hypothetical protein
VYPRRFREPQNLQVWARGEPLYLIAVVLAIP